MRKRTIALAMGVLIVLWAVPAFAQVAFETCEPEEIESVGNTTIRCEPCIQVLNYTEGTTIEVPVEWMVDAGFATFNDLKIKQKGRQFTPASKKSPASGTLGMPVLEVNSSGAGTTGRVNVPLTFQTLHHGQMGPVKIANAHAKLMLDASESGDPFTDTMVKCGVTVHVCVDIDAVDGNQCEEDAE